MSTPVNKGTNSNLLSGINSLSQLVAMLAPYFLPASLGTAPGAKGSSGGRTTVLTTASGNYVASLNGKVGAIVLPPPPPVQVATGTLIAGAYVWTFAAPFVSAPVVFAFPIGVPAAGALLYASAPTNAAVTITSTNAGDVRVLQLLAVGNPN